MTGYVGRFAPSPTGLLHAGSLVAALASWLDARAHGGRWLVRIEDVDTPRCLPEAGELILGQLARCGLLPDDDVRWQSRYTDRYSQALAQLVASGRAYPCACSRKEIEAAHAAAGLHHQRHGERPYPGTCRQGLQGRPARAWRLRCQATAPDAPEPPLRWHDRRLGHQAQVVSQEVGDFVLRRGDGLWAYQLAVVVDDADQGVTDVVRGEDLADNTPRQILLQGALGLPTPRYLHTPLVMADDGQKLSKQNGAQPLDLSDPLRALRAAGATLGLPADLAPSTSPCVADWLAAATQAWAARWPLQSPQSMA
jgi:glutamyl-Q tRNA(Asp) synthetase